MVSPHVASNINCPGLPSKMAFLKDWWSGSSQETKEEEEDKGVDDKKEVIEGDKGVEESSESGSGAGSLWNVKLDAESLSKGMGGGLLVLAWIFRRIYGCSE